MAIFFHDENIQSGLKRKRAIKSWLKAVLLYEERKEGEINIVLTTDENLREINSKYLSRDYYTDIITFDYSEGKRIQGDLFISIERVNENSEKYNVSKENELLRVMVHGLLHLMGYSDKKQEDKAKMRMMEEKYLALCHLND